MAAEPNRRHRAARAVLALFAGCSVAAVAGWALGVDPRAVARHLSGVSPATIIGCVISACFVFALQALRRHLVMQEHARLRYTDVLAGHVLGAAFNTLLPARGGDLIRVEYFARRTKKSRSTLVGIEIVDRWLHCAGWFPPLVVIAVIGALPRSFGAGLGAMAAVLVSWALVMVLVARRRAVETRPASRIRRAIASMQLGLGGFRARRTIWIMLLVAPLPWLWEAAALERAAHAFGIELTFAAAFSVLVGFNIATIVPSPGSLGSVEAGGALALAVLGVDHSVALAFMFAYHLTQLTPAVIAGLGVVVVRASSGIEAAPAVVASSAIDGVHERADRLVDRGHGDRSTRDPQGRACCDERHG